MLVIATSGHVDHGKSSLVQRLTGKNPDRLKEEQIREMTIDLGFAFFTTPKGNEVGMVDVPGHIDFIENMLAGLGGIDGVLIVVAADEGVMPQTREHVAILDLLGVNQGIIVITKTDLITDPGWIELIKIEVQDLLQGTSLEKFPVVAVSARTGSGISELLSEIDIFTKKSVNISLRTTPRLPVDRVFTMQGFGTIVTGTLIDGELKIGDEVEIYPDGLRSRVRGLQSQNQKIDTAFPGTRTAVNLLNITKESIGRGDVLAKPASLVVSDLIDVSIRLLDNEKIILRHNDVVNFYSGTSKRIGRIRVLGKKSISSSEQGFMQIEFENPVCVKNGDQFIIRKASPSITLGGGKILDNHPDKKYKLMDSSVMKVMEIKQTGAIHDLLIEETKNPTTILNLVKNLNLDEWEIKAEMEKLLENGVIVKVETGNDQLSYYISHDALTNLVISTEEKVNQLHNEFPTRKGFSLSEISKGSKIDEKILIIFLNQMLNSKRIITNGQLYWLPGITNTYSPMQVKALQLFTLKVDQNPYSPPSLLEINEILGKELVKDLIKNGELIQVSNEVVFREKEYLNLVRFVDETLEKNQKISIANLRDEFQTSRKYIVPFLEHMDRIKKTRRVGDERVKY